MSSEPLYQQGNAGGFRHGNMDLPIQFSAPPLCDVCLKPVRKRGTFSAAQLLESVQHHLDYQCSGSRSAIVRPIGSGRTKRCTADYSKADLQLHFQRRRSL